MPGRFAGEMFGEDYTLGVDNLSNQSSVPKSGSSIDWGNVINQGFALASQAFNSFGGRTVGTQFGYNPTKGGIYALAVPAYEGPGGGIGDATRTAQKNEEDRGPGSTLGSGLDGVLGWLMANPVITFGGVAALYLLFKEPPRRK